MYQPRRNPTLEIWYEWTFFRVISHGIWLRILIVNKHIIVCYFNFHVCTLQRISHLTSSGDFIQDKLHALNQISSADELSTKYSQCQFH